MRLIRSLDETKSEVTGKTINKNKITCIRYAEQNATQIGKLQNQ
jgi:hypothetical protein